MNILTEEELKERNRLLVLENDELLAENMRFKEVIDKVWKHIISEGIAINNLQNALEELKS